jgi:hypothetical protein
MPPASHNRRAVQLNNNEQSINPNIMIRNRPNYNGETTVWGKVKKVGGTVAKAGGILLLIIVVAGLIGGRNRNGASRSSVSKVDGRSATDLSQRKYIAPPGSQSNIVVRKSIGLYTSRASG